MFGWMTASLFLTYYGFIGNWDLIIVSIFLCIGYIQIITIFKLYCHGLCIIFPIYSSNPILKDTKTTFQTSINLRTKKDLFLNLSPYLHGLLSILETCKLHASGKKEKTWSSLKEVQS